MVNLSDLYKQNRWHFSIRILCYVCIARILGTIGIRILFMTGFTGSNVLYASRGSSNESVVIIVSWLIPHVSFDMYMKIIKKMFGSVYRYTNCLLML